LSPGCIVSQVTSSWQPARYSQVMR
jgi:hypothetical protein